MLDRPQPRSRSPRNGHKPQEVTMTISNQEFKIFTAKFPQPMSPDDWQEIIEGLFLDSFVRGIHVDKAIALGLIRAGMKGEEAIAFIRALYAFGNDAGTNLRTAAINSITTRSVRIAAIGLAARKSSAVSRHA
jgi:hypothetical protein